MPLPRIIPSLLIQNGRLVKTLKFADPVYVGDPINVVKIFNVKEVDELLLLDISDSRAERGPDFEIIQEICTEAFVPVAYGGGVTTIDQIDRILKLGAEKVVINSALKDSFSLVTAAANRFGSQAIVVSIDYRLHPLSGQTITYYNNGRYELPWSVNELAKLATDAGGGELILQSIEKDGTLAGYDLNVIQEVVKNTTLPVIASGGAGSLKDIAQVILNGGASGAAAGSFFVFRGGRDSVLVTYPTQQQRDAEFKIF